MKINVLGGGPAALYFAILLKQRDPSHRITIVERDGPHDTFGWGIVFSDRVLAFLKDEDEETYAVTGLVHDLDYERYPDLETGHPRHAIKELTDGGYPQEVIDAVAGHADFMGVPRETRMAKTLYAVDELSGFIAACALVRPTGIEGMKPKSVKKKLKQPSFAAAVNRDEVQRGIEELAVDPDEHIALIIEALAERAAELGLEPQEGSGADAAN